MQQAFDKKKDAALISMSRKDWCDLFTRQQSADSGMFLLHHTKISTSSHQRPQMLLQKHEKYTAQEIMAEVRQICGVEENSDIVRVDGLVLVFENAEICIADHAQLELASRLLEAYMVNSVRLRYSVRWLFLLVLIVSIVSLYCSLLLSVVLLDDLLVGI